MGIRGVLGALAALILIVCVGCGKENTPVKPKLTTKQLEAFYPGDISKVDHIEIRSGSTGELRVYTDQKVVQDWIEKVRHIPMIPDPNQEGKVGYLFAVGLFEGKEKKLGFSSTDIADHYYLHSKELAKQISDLFTSK
ncbi:hypothetical protein [Paenibacillus roseipurpureus]|uniref:Uncharacterized protein n=1 Tax=Paenibacillus roseopurpureus TaxID=2918901 RepID=A0AA96LNA2_9BACL|nr:hypothetical protein [Paenibacillus sp. MBLB1832]WNR44159.1 hypothetical protein MJB10_24180 [Paenibacillus sp. MBLB1832]